MSDGILLKKEKRPEDFEPGCKNHKCRWHDTAAYCNCVFKNGHGDRDLDHKELMARMNCYDPAKKKKYRRVIEIISSDMPLNVHLDISVNGSCTESMAINGSMNGRGITGVVALGKNTKVMVRNIEEIKDVQS